MIKYFPIEHFLNFNSKSNILIIYSLFLNLCIYGQNATLGGSISGDANICPGETSPTITNITPASGGGSTPIEYLWLTTSNPGQPISNWNNAYGVNNQASYTPPAIGITSYFIRCARRNGYQFYSAESNIITITVLPNPTTHINENPGTVSVNSTINFSAASSFNSTYNWDFDGDGIIDCNTKFCSYTFTNTGTFTVSLTVNNGSCSSTDFITITVDPTINSILDPCNCDNPQNFTTADGYFVHDFILINSAPNETWQLIFNSSGAIYNSSGEKLPLGTNIPEITNASGIYYLSIWFKSGEGFNIDLYNGSNILSIGTTNPCICINPLPVELVSFEAIIDASEKEVTLKWETATERNNSHFEVQQSLDGNQFDLLERVEGNGNSSLFQSYVLIHKNPVSGINYYRLKQVDFDGTQTYSNIISAKISTRPMISIVIPNPIKDIAVVHFEEELPKRTELQIFSITGQVLATYLVEDSFSQEINMDRFEKGIYFLRVKNARIREKEFFKILKF